MWHISSQSDLLCEESSGFNYRAHHLADWPHIFLGSTFMMHIISSYCAKFHGFSSFQKKETNNNTVETAYSDHVCLGQIDHYKWMIIITKREREREAVVERAREWMRRVSSGSEKADE